MKQYKHPLFLASTSMILGLAFLTFGGVAADGGEKPTTQSPEVTAASFRAEGPKGWADYVEAHAEALSSPNRHLYQVEHATLDAIAQQKDSYYSGLFWYNDLEEAKAKAVAEKKPILSLRLLGKLTDEMSCANSRFFRVALYPNEKVGTMLKENYVLHWSTERQVPQVTIDFGDGRVMKRTLTGNSIHYVLDEKGQPIEAFPGLMGPQMFLSNLEKAHDLYSDLVDMKEEKRNKKLLAYHSEQAEQLRNSSRLNGIPRTNPPTMLTPNPEIAMLQTRSKGRVERPMLTQLDLWNVAGMNNEEMQNLRWKAIAQNLNVTAKLDENSKAMMKAKNQERYADSNAFSSDVAAFEEDLLIESVKNEFSMHLMVHRWFETGNANNFEDLNQNVYARLFFTPKADPWLGLLPEGAYSAIENDGLVK